MFFQAREIGCVRVKKYTVAVRAVCRCHTPVGDMLESAREVFGFAENRLAQRHRLLWGVGFWVPVGRDTLLPLFQVLSSFAGMDQRVALTNAGDSKAGSFDLRSQAK